jgi:phytochrome B
MQLICDELRNLLHYDRVMMYQFHEDQHGEVMAESFSQFAKDAYMGLHFPSTDIPQANRAIFMTMRSRMIADVAAEASKVMQSARMNNDILLGASQLRGVSGCHGQYLSNMGVKATLVLSIIVNETQARVEVRSHGDDDDDGGWSFSRTRGHRRPRVRPKEKLWGLIVCHHYQCPHRVAYYQRSAAEFLVRVFASQLGRTLQKQHQRLERLLLRQQAIICSCLKFVADAEAGNSPPDHIPKMIASVLCTTPGSTALPLVANATGAAIILGDTLGLVGNCPDIEEIKKLVAWMQSTGAAQGLKDIGDTSTFSSGRRLPLGGMWSTHCLLNEGFPGAEALSENASGVLALDVALLDLPRYDGRYGHVYGAPGSNVDANSNVTPRNPQESDRQSSEDVADETMARSLDSAYSQNTVQPAVLIWFRGESVAEEAWAGDVKAPQARHQGAEMSPRESFKAVRKMLRCQSVPWEALEKNSATNMQLLFRDTMSSREQGILSSSIMATLGQRIETNSGGLGCDNDEQFRAAAEKLRTIIGTADLPMMRVNSDLIISEHNSCAGLILVGANRSAVGLTLMDFLEPNSANIMEVTMRNVVSEMIVPKPMLLRFKPPGAAGMSAVLQRMEAETRGDVDAFESSTYEMLVFWQLSLNNTTGKLSGVVLTGRDMGTHNSIMRSLEFSNLTESAGMSVQTSVYGDQHNQDPHGSISSIIANAVVPVASIDSCGRVEHWNTRMEFVTGLDRKQAEGQLLLGDLFGSKVSFVFVYSMHVHKPR